MARAALSLSLTELAHATGLAEKTIRRVEAACGRPPVSEQTLQRLKLAFEANGVRFIEATDRTDGPGIQLDWDPRLGETRADVLTPEEIEAAWKRSNVELGGDLPKLVFKTGANYHGHE